MCTVDCRPYHPLLRRENWTIKRDVHKHRLVLLCYLLGTRPDRIPPDNADRWSLPSIARLVPPGMDWGKRRDGFLPANSSASLRFQPTTSFGRQISRWAFLSSILASVYRSNRQTSRHHTSTSQKKQQNLEGGGVTASNMQSFNAAPLLVHRSTPLSLHWNTKVSRTSDCRRFVTHSCDKTAECEHFGRHRHCKFQIFWRQVLLSSANYSIVKTLAICISSSIPLSLILFYLYSPCLS